MMTRHERDIARTRISDALTGVSGTDATEIAAIAQRLLDDAEQLHMAGPAVEHQLALTDMLGATRAALAALHRGEDPAPWLEHALKPYGGIPAGAAPQALTADAAALAEAVRA